jgi:hypothetical protein
MSEDGDEDGVAAMDVVVVATAAAVAPLRQARTTTRTGEPSTLSSPLQLSSPLYDEQG